MFKKKKHFWNYQNNILQKEPSNLVECWWKNIKITDVLSNEPHVRKGIIEGSQQERRKEWKGVVKEWAGGRKIRAKAVRHLPAECGNHPPFTQRDDRCTYRGRVWDLSASLVKINPGGLRLEARRLVVMRPSWKAGGSNTCFAGPDWTGAIRPTSSQRALISDAKEMSLPQATGVSHRWDTCRALTRLFCILTTLINTRGNSGAGSVDSLALQNTTNPQGTYAS